MTANNEKGAWARYAEFYSGSRRWIAFAILLGVAELVMVIPVPMLIRRLFDEDIRNGRVREIVQTVLILAGLRLIATGTGLYLRRLSLETTKLAIQRMRHALLEKMYSLPHAWIHRADHAALHTTIVQETERVDVMSNALVALLIPSALTTVALATILFSLSPQLFLIVAMSAPVLYSVHRVLAGRLRDRTDKFRSAFENFSSGVLFVLRTMDLTRASAAESSELARQDKSTSELRETSSRMAWLQSAYGGIQTLVISLVMLVVLAVGGVQVSAGTISLGELASFYVAALLFAGAMNTFWTSLPTAVAGNRSLRNIDDLLSLEQSSPYSGETRFTFAGGLELDDVHFGYDNVPLLRGVSFAIRPGEIVSLHGPNGAGKTTIVQLLLGWQKPQLGRVLADGNPYDTLYLEDLLKGVGLLPQDPVIFAGAIAENIAYGREHISAEQMHDAIKIAGADDLLSALPAGLATMIGEEGQTVSGGERQRIALARGLVHSPALLIMDEPTNHLDVSDFRAILGRIRERSPSMSILIISHDQSVIDEADAIYRLEKGALSRRVTSRRMASSTGEPTVALVK
ncbi:MAG TPA: ABC transporter ATP-binding protein [Gemmatimonadaceae bacterium]|nr:ABC transporter ATP-binding protein [Gemmatimonadaceae bacterium]